MNNSEQEIQEQKAILKSQVELCEALKRLEENKDFQMIYKDYVEATALMCLRMASNVNYIDDIRDKCDFKAKACGAFFNYLESVKEAGKQAKKDLEELKEIEDSSRTEAEE